MSKSSVQFSTLFEERESPAERLGPTPPEHFLQDLSGADYEKYYACRGPNPSPVKTVADRAKRTEKKLYELIDRVEFVLDRNILLKDPQWAYSLTPFAIDLRTLGGKVGRAEKYLRLLVQWLPRLPLDPLDCRELAGFAREHLGGILLHRDKPDEALECFESATAEFNGLINRLDVEIPDLAGTWKHRALQCQLLTVEALRLADEIQEAKDRVEQLLAEVIFLRTQSRKSPRSFRFRGHQFEIVVAEVQRSRGAVLAQLGDKQTALTAHDQSIGVLEDVTTPDKASNQFTASRIKRAATLCRCRRYGAALRDLDRAIQQADGAQEVGVYKVFVARGQAVAYQGQGDKDAARSTAEWALTAARRLGLFREERLLNEFLTSV